jgi:uncharacterized protein involved in exopolysaccharide biosynthesis
MPTAALAQLVNERLLQGVNRFNLQTRQSQARAERRFAEDRLHAVRDDVRAVEDSLQQFLQRNRDFKNAPSLTFQHDRLQREVARRQQIYATLSELLEQARLDEVRDTPVITLVEAPYRPVRPDPRGLTFQLVLALAVGALAGAMLCFLLQGIDADQEDAGGAVHEFRQQWGQLRKDLRRPWRLLFSVRNSAGGRQLRR